MEERAKDMCWSWNAKDIDPDKDNRKVWIPMTPKTLEEEAEEARGSPRTPSGVKEMMVYPVGQGPTGDTQARMLVRQAVATLKTTGPVVILANEESSEESKATGQKEGEPPAVQQKTRPRSATRKGTTGVRAGKEPVERQGPKSEPAVMLSTPQPVLCDRCRWASRNCFSRKKGPETLIMCAVCFKIKMSCKTGDDGAQGRKKVKTLVRRTWKDSMAEDVESEDTEEDGKARDGGPEMEVAQGREEARRCGRTTRCQEWI